MAGGDRTTVSSGKQLRRSAGAVPSGAQIRAARALLGWTVRDLARRAVVSITAVNLIEGATGLSSTTAGQARAVQEALETAGVEFLGDDAPGVRLHPKRRQRKC